MVVSMFVGTGRTQRDDHQQSFPCCCGRIEIDFSSLFHLQLHLPLALRNVFVFGVAALFQHTLYCYAWSTNDGCARHLSV